MNRLISIDWLDGCWKTTLGKKLAERIGGKYYYTPPEKIHSIREIADNTTPLIRSYYYMMWNLIASRDYEEMLKFWHVVSDRYFYATRAYHEPLWIFLPVPDELIKPDAIVYISASWDSIEKRLKARFWQTPFEDLDYLKKVATHYEEILKDVPNVVKVDSTDRNPDDVTNEIIEKLSFLDIVIN